MANWAAIVYGRTYEIDFRLLALPVDFTQSEQDSLLANIQTITRYPEELSGQPRWAVFRRHTLSVFLVACTAHDLILDVQPSGIDLTRDQRGRGLYTVVGYATRVSPGESVQLPAYLGRDIRELSSIYQEYVAGHWTLKSYVQDQVTATKYQPLHLASSVLPIETNSSYFALNITQSNAVVIWPDTPDHRKSLWAEAAKQLGIGQDVSLCLGLPTLKSMINGAFLNGTAFDVAQKEKINRIPEELLPSKPTVKDQSIVVPKSTLDRRQTGIATLLLLSGSLLGGVNGVLIGNSVDLTTKKNEPNTEQETQKQSAKNSNLLLYGGLGAVAGSLLSLVLGMLLAKRRSRSASSGTSMGRRQIEQEKALEQASMQPDPMFGFRPKDQQNDDDIVPWS